MVNFSALTHSFQSFFLPSFKPTPSMERWTKKSGLGLSAGTIKKKKKGVFWPSPRVYQSHETKLFQRPDFMHQTPPWWLEKSMSSGRTWTFVHRGIPSWCGGEHTFLPVIYEWLQLQMWICPRWQPEGRQTLVYQREELKGAAPGETPHFHINSCVRTALKRHIKS